ncbi:hypothetical protein TRIP_C20815 [Candidatus Zixiibacteriota bacterium]|nr:hypothetical protein TRIP_C20815 [candidate division Zixibacteria bacterium]
MKRLFFHSWKGIPAVLSAVLIGAFLIGGCAVYSSGGSAGAEVDYNSGDYGIVAQYGQWEDYPPFGQIWRPWVAPDWQPFEYGNWEWTSSGWTWVSYEPFGWIVYHYGNWDYDADGGWYWIPGDVWSPARVQWTTYGDYTCWAPLPPPRVSWGNPWDRDSEHHWVIVKNDNFTRENVYNYRITRIEHNNTSRPTFARRAPDVRVIERRIDQPVPRIRINMEKKHKAPGQFRRMILPPEINQRVDRNRNFIEQQVIRRQELRPMAQRINADQNRGQAKEAHRNNGQRKGHGK